MENLKYVSHFIDSNEPTSHFINIKYPRARTFQFSPWIAGFSYTKTLSLSSFVESSLVKIKIRKNNQQPIFSR